MSFDDRATGLSVLYDRVLANRDTLEIVTFKRSSFYGLRPEDLLCVVMSEGNDIIVRRMSRDGTGRPFLRELDVLFTLIARKEYDLKLFYPKFRDCILSDCVLSECVSIQEQKAVGPSDYLSLPNTQAMQCICTMNYQD